jgi:hypothetical protein
VSGVKIVRLTSLADVPAGSTIQAIWIAESVAGRPNDSRMDEVPPTEVGGTRNQANLSHQRPPNGWPTGSYRVDLYLSGQFERTLRFSVQAGGVSPVSSPLPASSPAPTSSGPTTGTTGTTTLAPPTVTPPAGTAGTVAPGTGVPAVMTLSIVPTPTNGEQPPGTI